MCAAILDGLLSTKSFSEDHCEAIRVHKTEKKQIRKMLTILECRSFLQYEQFIITLRNCYHEHAADIIESNAGMCKFFSRYVISLTSDMTLLVLLITSLKNALTFYRMCLISCHFLSYLTILCTDKEISKLKRD